MNSQLKIFVHSLTHSRSSTSARKSIHSEWILWTVRFGVKLYFSFSRINHFFLVYKFLKCIETSIDYDLNGISARHGSSLSLSLNNHLSHIFSDLVFFFFGCCCSGLLLPCCISIFSTAMYDQRLKQMRRRRKKNGHEFIDCIFHRLNATVHTKQ